jgi:RND family efflux transporter MFP subunit
MQNKDVDLSSLRIDRSGKSSNNSGWEKITKYILPVILVIVILLLGYYGWKTLFSADIEVSLVTVSKISPLESNAVLTASGYVVAQRKASVASKATGRLIYLGVVEGDAVKKDQIIARLEDSDVKAALEQAKANLQLNEASLQDAKNTYDREEKLYALGGAPKSDLDAAEANYKRVLASIEVAKAQVQGAEVALENTLIRAPFDGTVLTKDADVGEIVSPLGASSTSRAAVVTLADMTSLQVEADVSESNIERIKTGQDCEITLDAYPDSRYAGYVAKIVPTADRSKATVLVKVAFRKYDSKVLPEMSAKVLFLNKKVDEKSLSEKAILVVPYTSIRKLDQKEYVYRIKDGRVYEVEIKTGRNVGDYTEVISGVEEGDRVIQKVTPDVKEGTKVIIK